MQHITVALAGLACLTTVTAHTITICYSASPSNPGNLQLWFLTYHDISETPQATVRVTLPDTSYTDYFINNSNQSCQTPSITGDWSVSSMQNALAGCPQADVGMQLACFRHDGTSASDEEVGRDPLCLYGAVGITAVTNIAIPSVSGWSVGLLNTNVVLEPNSIYCAPGAGTTLNITSPAVLGSLEPESSEGSGSGSGEAKIDEGSATVSGKKGKKGKKGKSGGKSIKSGSGDKLSTGAAILGNPNTSFGLIVGVAAVVAGVGAVIHRRNRMKGGSTLLPAGLTDQVLVMADENTPLV